MELELRSCLSHRGAAAKDDRPLLGSGLRANGIRVNTVAAGPTRTDAAIDTLGDGVEQMGSQTPLGRTADPREIAEAIVFLASPRASYLTGATVAVDGGYTAISAATRAGFCGALVNMTRGPWLSR
jgi:enoyl-[acyl-carrier-protein] reductase (NADH)